MIWFPFLIIFCGHFIDNLLWSRHCVRYLLSTCYILGTSDRDERNNRTKKQVSEFPGSPVFRTQSFHWWSLGSIPGQGTKIQQVVQQGQKKKKQISSLFLGGYNQVSWQTLIKPSSKKIEFQMWYVWRKNFQCCEKVTRVWNQAFDIHGSGEKNVSQSRLILCDPIDSRLPGSLVHGILQARTLEWVAIPF